MARSIAQRPSCEERERQVETDKAIERPNERCAPQHPEADWPGGQLVMKPVYERHQVDQALGDCPVGSPAELCAAIAVKNDLVEAELVRAAEVRARCHRDNGNSSFIEINRGYSRRYPKAFDFLGD